MRALIVSFALAFILLGTAGYMSLSEKPDITPVLLFLSIIAGYAALSLIIITLCGRLTSAPGAFCIGLLIPICTLIFGNDKFVGYILEITTNTSRVVGLGVKTQQYVMVPALVCSAAMLTTLLSETLVNENQTVAESAEQRDKLEVAEP